MKNTYFFIESPLRELRSSGFEIQQGQEMVDRKELVLLRLPLGLIV